MKAIWLAVLLCVTILAPVYAQATVDTLPRTGSVASPAQPKPAPRPPPVPTPANVGNLSDLIPGPDKPNQPPSRPAQPSSLPEPAPSTAAPRVTCADVPREIFGDCLKAAKAQYDYAIGSLENRRQNFEWQLRSTKWIFLVVVLLVASGVGFAGFQLYVVMTVMYAGQKRRHRAEAGAETPPNLGGDIEISADRIKVSSSVLGVVILGLAMAFFYLYARYVYPITEVGSPPN
jgi:hypothetical protein